MFQNTNFWIGLGIGVVAGIFGYKLMQQRQQQLLALQQPVAAGTPSLEELQRQKEALEDMIAAQEAQQ